MKKLSPMIIGLIQTVGVMLYCLSVILFLNTVFSHSYANNEIFSPLLMLLTFIISALITASMVLGYPLWLFFVEKEQKKRALTIVGSTVAWLFTGIILIITSLVIF